MKALSAAALNGQTGPKADLEGAARLLDAMVRATAACPRRDRPDRSPPSPDVAVYATTPCRTATTAQAEYAYHAGLAAYLVEAQGPADRMGLLRLAGSVSRDLQYHSDCGVAVTAGAAGDCALSDDGMALGGLQAAAIDLMGLALVKRGVPEAEWPEPMRSWWRELKVTEGGPPADTATGGAPGDMPTLSVIFRSALTVARGTTAGACPDLAALRPDSEAARLGQRLATDFPSIHACRAER